MSNMLESFKKQSSRMLNQVTGKGGETDEESAASVELSPANNNDNSNNSDDDSQQVLMQDNDSSWTEELSNYCPKLTFQERLIGFATTFGLGYLIAFFSFRFFIKLIEGNPVPFAINYTAGHVLQLLSSMFLCGPQRQFRLMFDSTRYMTSMVYLGCLAVTLILIFIPLKPHFLKLLILVSLTMAQFAASCWYSLSYIPYGRRTALRILFKTLGLAPPNQSVFGSGASNAAASTSGGRSNSYTNIFTNALS